MCFQGHVLKIPQIKIIRILVQNIHTHTQKRFDCNIKKKIKEILTVEFIVVKRW